MSHPERDQVFDVRRFRTRVELQVQDGLLALAAVASAFLAGSVVGNGSLLHVAIAIVLAAATLDRLDQIVTSLDVRSDRLRVRSVLRAREVGLADVVRVEDRLGARGPLSPPMIVAGVICGWLVFTGLSVGVPFGELGTPILFVFAIIGAWPLVESLVWRACASLTQPGRHPLRGLHVVGRDGHTIIRYRGELGPEDHALLAATLAQLDVPFTSVGDEEA